MTAPLPANVLAAAELSRKLDALIVEVHELRVLPERRSERRLSAADRRAITKLLPALGGVFGSDTITAKDIVEAARSDAGAALRLTLHTTSTRALGRLLKRCDGVVVGDYTLVSSGYDARSRAWHVERLT